MKKALSVFLLALMLGWYGCSSETFAPTAGTRVVIDGAPMIFDPSVIYMGSTVGQILTSQWNNGVTCLTISLNNDSQNLQQSNMAAMVKNGQLNLVALSAAGEPLSNPECILGFKNNLEFQWFKFKNLINNMNMAAGRQAQRLAALSGPQG
jgi:hypothetical protein